MGPALSQIRVYISILYIFSTVGQSVCANQCDDWFSVKAGAQVKNEFEYLEFSELSNIQFFEYMTYGKYATANFRGLKVFLKSKKTIDVEAGWLKKLNKINIGAKFYGITTIGDSDYLIIQFIDGANSKFGPKESGVVLTIKMISSIKDQLRSVILLGGFPQDAQFILTREGEAFLIDAEFSPWQHSDPSLIDFFVEGITASIVSKWTSTGGRDSVAIAPSSEKFSQSFDTQGL